MDLKFYVLRLLKGNVSMLTDGIDEGNFDINALMYYDNVIISLAGDEFSDFGKLPIVQPDAQLDHERRKLNLRTLDNILKAPTPISKSGDRDNSPELPMIFQKEFYEDYPIMLISLLEVNGNWEQKIRKLDNKLANIKDGKCADISLQIEYALFGALGLADFVLITRARNFSDAFKLVDVVIETVSPRSIYTVPAVVKGEQISKWDEPAGEDAPKVSIRVSFRPNGNITKNMNNLIRDVRNSRVFEDSSLVFFRNFGRYDLEIVGKVCDNGYKAFYALIFGDANCKKSCLSMHGANVNEVATINTRFLSKIGNGDLAVNRDCREKCNTACVGRYSSTSCQQFDKNYASLSIEENQTSNKCRDMYLRDIKTWISTLLDGESFSYLSDNEKGQTSRLLSRIYYTNQSIYFADYVGDTLLLAKAIYTLAEQGKGKSPQSLNHLKVVLSDFIKDTYTYLENRVLSVRIDFESLDRLNLSYGESSHLLAAYSSLLDDFSLILDYIRGQTDEGSRRADSWTKIHAMVSFSNEIKQTEYLILGCESDESNVNHKDLSLRKNSKYTNLLHCFCKLPSTLLYNVPSAIALMLHEAGHRIMHERALRNKSFVDEALITILYKEFMDAIAEAIVADPNASSVTVASCTNDFMDEVFGSSVEKIDVDGGNYCYYKVNDKAALWKIFCKECKAKFSTQKNSCTNNFSDMISCIGAGVRTLQDKLTNVLSKARHRNCCPIELTKLLAKIEWKLKAFTGAVWREAFADLFMVKALSLSSSEYLTIMDDYFKLHSMDISDQFIIRIFAVCMYMDNVSCEFDNMNNAINYFKTISHCDTICQITANSEDNNKDKARTFIFQNAAHLKNALCVIGNKIDEALKSLGNEYNSDPLKHSYYPRLDATRNLYRQLRSGDKEIKNKAAVDFSLINK